MPAIDRLEGFRPGGPSLYRRVLVSVCNEHGMALPVWLYIGPSCLIDGRFLSSGRWPS
ncbi:hypothetical protein [Desulfoglaeba alkanexedens]|uniref:hypothetical protein n=1 Tax=Desulfoglaeba alkanexedens TaxID=361111 RepID=UPI00319E7335